MAKRKSRRRTYKKRKKSSPFKKIIVTLLFVIAAIFSLYYYEAYYNSESHTDIFSSWYSSIETELKKVTEQKKTPQATHSISYDQLTIPARLYDREEQIIHHTGFSVSYNEAWRIPNWTSYEMTREKTKGTVKRSNHFKPDPRILGVSATNKDYANSGYDRGHMVPAADMKWSEKAMQESFYFSNICPQLHNLNAGDWKTLEEKVREWAIRDSAIIVFSGPIVNPKAKKIGVTKVSVPDAFYKVILSPYQANLQGIGFIMKQEKGKKPLRSYAVSIDSIEKVTGINFFHQLPDEIEAKIESQFSLSYWGL